MKVLVIGGTGTVGSAVVSELLARGHEPRVMTRSADKARQLPAGTAHVVADLENPSTLPAAFRATDAAFLLAPVARNETEQALAAVDAARTARIGHLVYMSVVRPPGSQVIPHFASKVPVEKAVQDSGLAWTILQPNSFFQNDRWFRDAVMKFGVYPQPLGPRGLNRVDVRDIAEAAVIALTRGGGAGIVPLNGPRGLTGDDTARVYSELLGRSVRYGGDDLDVWAQQVSTVYPAWMVEDFRIMYDYFIRFGLHASGRDFAAQEALLGHAPRSFEAFAAELVQQWTS
jgi:uncharacterized protein YbjT (DUF2867 family)